MLPPNPAATAAVAGLFVGLDLIRMYKAEKEAAFEIVLQSAEIMCRNAIWRLSGQQEAEWLARDA